MRVGYIRVSTDEQATEGVSLAVQGQKITQYCELNDIPLDVVYWDPGVSGKNIAGRPGIKALLDEVESGSVTDLIVFKLDRLGRNTIEVLTMVEIFEKHGVTFHSLSERIDTSSAMGKFFLRIMAALAEMERDQIAERTRSVMAAKKANGEKVSSHAPFGFRFDDDGHVVEDPQELRAMEIIRKLRDEGLSLRKISSRLAKDGFMNRKGRPYGASSIMAMLSL